MYALNTQLKSLRKRATEYQMPSLGICSHLHLILTLVDCFMSQFILCTGINVWPGKQMHSHNYRTPEPFQDQVCVTPLSLHYC